MGTSRELAQLLAVVFHCTLMFLQPVLPFVAFGFLLTRLWPLMVLYLLFMLYEWNVAETGGRRLEFCRKGPVGVYGSEYLGCSFVGTADLSPRHNYLVGHHPHGILCLSSPLVYALDVCGLGECYPKLRTCSASLKAAFWVPFAREHYLSCGVVSVSKESITHMCTKMGTGNIICVVLGGAEEVQYATPGSVKVVVKRRRGFFRLAMQTGSKVIPSYCFGENDIYSQVVPKPGSLLYKLQQLVKKVFGFFPPLFYGRFLWIPRRGRLTTVLGSPIDVPKIDNPTVEDIEKCQKLYIAGLKDIFDNYKSQYHTDPNAELEVL